ncbi:MAG: UDP-N-acetylmuramoyl-L-alanyl-D-glutamate--2,6-diaminopimelate ligase [Gallionella sp.]
MSFPFNQLKKMNIEISQLVTDSRKVQAGDTFIAYPGEQSDGRDYIDEAIARGANAVIWEQGNFAWPDQWQVANLGVTDLRHKVGGLANSVYETPSEKLWMVGVTGTNGKTSTSHWIAHALNDAGRKCALIGTLGNGFTHELQATINTTPDAVLTHSLLAEYLNRDAQAVAMEVSSHALSQDRVNGVHFDVAMLTNLSRDHLDYHGDMQSYADAKRKLFDLDRLKYAVLNFDDAYGVELSEQLQDAPVEVIGYGLTDASLRHAENLGVRMVYGSILEMDGSGLKISVHSSWGAAQIDSGLVGRFNAANLLGSLAVLLVSEVELNDAVRSLGEVKPVAGRMERVGGGQLPTVIVDYAHTPDALEKVLLTLQETKKGSGILLCVFGCGGDRDQGKRSMMGLVAEKYSDTCFVTSDNPRNEDPQAIIAQIVGGMSGKNHEIIVDRAEAIQQAIKRAKKADIVLIAGKGHEEYQEVLGIRHPFSDIQIARHTLGSAQNAAEVST